MKRGVLFFLLVLVILPLVLLSCEEDHQHSFEERCILPSCTEGGFTLHICAGCGETWVDAETAALGHQFLSYTSNADASYLSDGTKSAMCERENCKATDTVTDENTRLSDYEITYMAKSDDIVLHSITLGECLNKSVEYSAPDVVGYKFLGWSDGVSEQHRVDDISQNGKTIVANYEIECLDMPIIVINTEEYQDIVSKEIYLDCEVSIINAEEAYCLDKIGAGIRGRGNSTWNLEKKPYRIKFDSKQSLFGSSYKQKSWTLLANYADKSLSRNAVAYELSEQMEGIEFSSMHQFVELYLNGTYQGVYLLCDQMQTGTGRVDVDEELYEDGDTGYLIELDGRAPSEGVLDKDYFTVNDKHYAIKTPDTEDEAYNPDIYVTYIKSYIEACFAAFESESWADVCELIDVDSFVDAYIIIELFANPDCGWSSFYMYKDRGGKLFCGPLWDFDIGAGNWEAGEAYIDECRPDIPLYGGSNVWFRALLGYQEFKNMVKQRLAEKEQAILSVIENLNPTQGGGYYTMYGKALERNFERWDILKTYIWNNTQTIMLLDSVRTQQLYTRDWLLARYYFILSEF